MKRFLLTLLLGISTLLIYSPAYVAPRRCGNGTVNMWEQCDDGNTSNTDACLNNCRRARCRDGFVQAGVEECDDGNLSNRDACLKTCRRARCGDRIVQAGVEECDDGNATTTDSCVNCQNARCGDGFLKIGFEECDGSARAEGIPDSATCSTTCRAHWCGDGRLDGGEQCDDGNTITTDSCVNCRNTRCGDGFVIIGVEECDGLARAPGIAASATCDSWCRASGCGDGRIDETIHGVEECDGESRRRDVPQTAPCDSQCRAAWCGNGRIDGLEECDGFLARAPGIAASAPCGLGCRVVVCGDDQIDGVEECDGALRRAGVPPTAPCDSQCRAAWCGNIRIEGTEECDGSARAGDIPPLVPLTCVNCRAYYCGDGAIDGLEECDGSALRAGVPAGAICTNSTCRAAWCGNGRIDGTEDCDGSVLRTGVPAGAICTNSTCRAAWCGNIRIDGTEECDGSARAGDIPPLVPLTCVNCRAYYCGDGAIDGTEECDGLARGVDIPRSTICSTTCLAAWCGNGRIDGTEDCDGLARASGISATTPCDSSCHVAPVCGNGRIERGEQCDGGLIQPQTCEELGFMGGGTSLRCNASCRFDTSGCIPSPTGEFNGISTAVTLADSGCGNWMVDGTEACDGPYRMLRETCETRGYAGGTLRCDSDCRHFDSSGCYGTPQDLSGLIPPSDPDYRPSCGRGFLDDGEVCDRPRLPPEESLSIDPDNILQRIVSRRDCTYYGFYGGELQCDSSCQAVTTYCYGAAGDPLGGTQHCGDGVINTGEECDGTALGGATCESLYHCPGSLRCSADCRWVASSCPCGSSSEP